MAFPLLLSLLLFDCKKDSDSQTINEFPDFVTENVVLVVVDGPRYSETWGDAQSRFIPRMKADLSPKGIINDKFYNWGVTRTMPGHTALITGVYEDIDNAGREFPSYPSILQTWLSRTQSNPNKAWIVASKKKLAPLANCTDIKWRNSFVPQVDAQTRLDFQTYECTRKKMRTYHPNLVFVNLSGPDVEGHANNWTGYLKAIRETDSLVNELQNFIDTDPHYAGKTTLIVTNDHGRHVDGIKDGFISHGDHCSGCTHINFYAYGPDFKENEIISQPREQIDIAPTIAYLMGFEMEAGSGEIMHELFK